jgi:hypothetical protein
MQVMRAFLGILDDNFGLMVLIAVTASAMYAIPRMKASYLNRGVLRWWKQDDSGDGDRS